jgi:hypothetical protein
LTFCSGLQATAFWAWRAEFDLTWWLANGYLLIYPLFLFRACSRNARSNTPHGLPRRTWHGIHRRCFLNLALLDGDIRPDHARFGDRTILIHNVWHEHCDIARDELWLQLRPDFTRQGRMDIFPKLGRFKIRVDTGKWRRHSVPHAMH